MLSVEFKRIEVRIKKLSDKEWLSSPEDYKNAVRKYFTDKTPISMPYNLGYENNNCFKTGCVQGGIGYWQKIQRQFPEKFEKMAELEHELSEAKGKPVTICKDQSARPAELVFLKPNPDYPEVKDIGMMKGIEPTPIPECFGFCNTKD